MAQPDNQSDRQARPAHMRVIELAEWFLEHVPVDQPGQPDQRVAQADASRLMQPSTPNTVASTGRTRSRSTT